MATDSSGGFVVAWFSDTTPGDTDGGVHARRYDAEGAALGAQFQLNSYTTGSQGDPSVAVDASGGFVVVWTSGGSPDDDSAGESVQARRFDAQGAALGAQFQVNSYTTGDQGWSNVATIPSGGFVVVWESQGSLGDDTANRSIQGQRFDAEGAAIGAQFQVNTYTTSAQRAPVVATTPNDGFVVVWTSTGSPGTDTNATSIQAQRFDSDASTLGAQFQVNSTTTGNQETPEVAVDPDGDFVIVWTSDRSLGTDSSDHSVQARRYSSGGDPIGAEIQLNSYTSLIQAVPSVAVDQNGGFVATWQSQGSSDSDSSSFSIQAQRFQVTAEVGDCVWLDQDLDGLQDMSEPGVEGVAVHLYEAGGSLVDSTSTDTDGAFLFHPKIGLAGVIDQFYLAFEPPNGVPFTTTDAGADDAIDSDADQSLGQTGTIEIASAGESHLDWDAGLIAAQIGDRVWLDDGDGLQAGGEPGVENVTVNLFAADGTLIDTTSTDASGAYEFLADAGDFYLEFVPLAGTTFAPRDQGSDDDLDSDAFASTGTTTVFTVTLGQVDGTRDAGLETDTDEDGVADRIDNCPDHPNPDQEDIDGDGTGDACEPPPMAQVGDRVWLDANGNGVQNGGETGVAGVTVNLYREPDPPFFHLSAATLEDTAATDADGYYSFVVDPGTYYLEFICSSDSFSSLDQGANDAVDSDVEPSTATTSPFELGDGAADGTWDAGLLDPDLDGIACSDNCPDVANSGQEDDDLDGSGNACDFCQGDDTSGDSDGDGICADRDCDDGDPTNACFLFGDGFESGNTSGWSSTAS